MGAIQLTPRVKIQYLEPRFGYFYSTIKKLFCQRLLVDKTSKSIILTTVSRTTRSP